MNTQLTRKWEYDRFHHSAMFGDIYLQCIDMSRFYSEKRWAGIAILNSVGIQKVGPNRMSIRAARRDAERLAVELLRDIRDGTKALLASYNMGEDD